MRSVFWIVVGAALAVFVITRGRKLVHSITPAGIAEQGVGPRDPPEHRNRCPRVRVTQEIHHYVILGAQADSPWPRVYAVGMSRAAAGAAQARWAQSG